MRLHLFEFEDQPWLPGFLRNSMTAYLATTYGLTPFPAQWARHIERLLGHDRINEIVDLGSGAGGPLPLVLRELKEKGFAVRATLTDLYPNPETELAGDDLVCWPTPVDATSVPPQLAGIRTMFSAFHHFRPKAAHRILRDAFEQRRPICIFEGASRSPAGLAAALLIPLLVLLLTPRVRPVRLAQILFTYLLPILPILIFWDGLVSQLRSYSMAELSELAQTLPSPDYLWDIGEIRAKGVPAAAYLVGAPIVRVTPCESR